MKAVSPIRSTLQVFALVYAIAVGAWTAWGLSVDAGVLGNDFLIPGILAAVVASMRRFRPPPLTWKQSRELALKAVFVCAVIVSTAWLIGAWLGPSQDIMPFELFAVLLPIQWLLAVCAPVAVLFAFILIGNLDPERRHNRAHVSSE